MRKILLLLVALGLGVLVASQNPIESYDPPRTVIQKGVEIPGLSAFEVVDYVFDPEGGRISLALELTDRATNGGIIADLMELYRWSGEFYPPTKCGDDYPPELCKIGATDIWVLQRGQVTVVGGVAEAYEVIWVMGLDQVQIDRLLASIPPATIAEMDQFHQRVSQNTGGTGGYSQFPNPPVPFGGLSR